MKAKTSINFFLCLMVVTSLLCWSRPAQAILPTCTSGPHGGTLAADETWCASDNPHTMSIVIVPAGITLTLEAGTVVKGIDSFTDLRILSGGHLEAIGTPAQPITLTSLTDSGPDQWNGLNFRGGTGNLDYVTVRYAGSLSAYSGMAGNVSLLDVQGVVHIQHSRILDVGNLAGNSVHGLNVTNSHLALSDTFFGGNAVESGVGVEPDGYPLGIFGASSVVTMTGNTFTGNLHDRVLLGDWNGYPMTANAQVTLYRQAALEGYEFGTNYTIPTGMTLNVEPGVTLMNRWGQGIQVLGRLEAVGTATQPITITSATNTGPGQWAGLYFNGGTGELEHVTVRYGGACGGGCSPVNVILRNVGGEGVQISNSLITRADSPGNSPAGLQVENSIAQVSNTVISDNGSESTAAGIRILGASSQVEMKNVAVIHTSQEQGGGKAIYLEAGANLAAAHTTIAGNRGDGISVNGATAVFTNTLLSQNSTGIRVENNASVTLAQTLWDRNEAPLIGTIQETGHLEGLAGLAQDGIHLTRYSAALSQGVDAGVAEDIDGESRPRPAGTAPDLGADEFPYNPDEFFAAEQVAFPGQWLFQPNAVSGLPGWVLSQRYLIRYYYGSSQANPPALTVAVTDTLPAGLALATETHFPAMVFGQQASSLYWQTQEPVQADAAGEILFSATGNPLPQQVLVNHTQLAAGDESFSWETAEQVPLFAPRILTPGSGELCPASDHTLSVVGVAQPGTFIRLFENGTQVVTTTVDAQGAFTATYSSTLVGIAPATGLSATACLPGDAAECSAASMVTIHVPQSFWDPQRSSWEGTPGTGPLAGQHLEFQFRNSSGEFSTQDWQIPGVSGFSNTTLHLYTCRPIANQNVSVVADGTTYLPGAVSEPWYDFDITGWAHQVSFVAENELPASGVILIDPDGYVFDVTQGFDALDPTLHAIQGVTVTCMISAPEWGGWVPWPAQLYNHQENPQVTGEDGYFAFFTPPGQYYLQVDGPAGYQSWRSPVVEVVNEIVHVNAPLTPWSTPAAPQIQVNSSGLSQPQVVIEVGQSVTWVVDGSWLAPDQFISLIENPIPYIRSELDPLTNGLGFDSGRLIPGQAYTYQFSQPGTYLYNDGYGHTGQVIVKPFRLFLPLALRSSSR